MPPRSPPRSPTLNSALPPNSPTLEDWYKVEAEAEKRARDRISQENMDRRHANEQKVQMDAEERREQWRREEEEREAEIVNNRKSRMLEAETMQLQMEEDARLQREKARERDSQKWAEREMRKAKNEEDEMSRRMKRAEDEAAMKRRSDQACRGIGANIQREMSDRTNLMSDVSPEKAQQTKDLLERLRRDAQRRHATQNDSPSRRAEFVVPEVKPFRRREFASAPSYEERHHDSPGSGFSSRGSTFARFYFNLVGGKGTVDTVSIRKDDEAWSAFEDKAKRASTIHISDIPIPQAAGCIDNEIFKRWAMRWHPDKFIQKFGSKLSENERDSIVCAVKGVFQEISAAKC